MAGSTVRVGQAVQPVVNLLRDELLDAPMVFGDETELEVLKEPGRSAQSKSYIWAQMTDGSGKDGTGPPIRLFTYAASRSTKTAMECTPVSEGAVLMTDGYDVYDAVAKAQHPCILAAGPIRGESDPVALPATSRGRRRPGVGD